MELIRTLSQMVNCLRSRGIRRKVAVVCPNDPHTEYVIIRSLREEIAEYLLVTDSEEDEADAYILKETGAKTEDAYYEFVEDSTELEVISKVFEQMLDDIDLKYE